MYDIALQLLGVRDDS